MTNRYNNKGPFQKLISQPFWLRLTIFILITFIWFALIGSFGSDSNNAVAEARNTKSYWLLTVLFFAIVSPFFFKYSRKNDKIDK